MAEENEGTEETEGSTESKGETNAEKAAREAEEREANKQEAKVKGWIETSVKKALKESGSLTNPMGTSPQTGSSSPPKRKSILDFLLRG